jgi:hypothetical protein
LVPRVPFKIAAHLLIEHAGFDLQQMVGTHWGPPVPGFLHKPLAQNLVDRGAPEIVLCARWGVFPGEG